MAMSINKAKGFSLIELMIATSILSFIMFSGYYAYSLFSDGWNKRVNYYWQTNQNSIGLEALIRTLESSASYVVLNSESQASILFNGTESQLMFVSNSPIFEKGAALIELSVVNMDGTEKLIYREKSLQAKPVVNWGNSNVEWSNSIVLISDITELHFSYFGFSSFVSAVKGYNIYEGISQGTGIEVLSWQDKYGIVSHRILPMKVNVQFSTISGKRTNLTIDLPEYTVRNVLRYMREDF